MFKNTVELLLSGAFICSQTNEKSFLYLNEESHFFEVQDYLLKIGRLLKKTESENAFYLGYSDLSDFSSRQQVAKEFSLFRANLRPMVEFIQLSMSSDNSDIPLSIGDSISVAKVTEQVESNEMVREIANNIARVSKIKPGNNTSDKVSNIFSFIEKTNLIVLSNKVDKIYSITGMIDYLYEALSYINDREDIADKVAEEEGYEEEQQGTLF